MPRGICKCPPPANGLHSFFLQHLVFLVIAICATGLLVILGFHWTARLYSSMELVPLAAEADEQNSTSDPPEVV